MIWHKEKRAGRIPCTTLVRTSALCDLRVSGLDWIEHQAGAVSPLRSIPLARAVLVLVSVALSVTIPVASAPTSAVLRDRLYEVHANRVASLENAQMTEQELATKVDALIEAHDALEKRVARHIVLLRPQLSQEQRDHLSGLCRGTAGAGDVPLSTHPNPVRDLIAGLVFERT